MKWRSSASSEGMGTERGSKTQSKGAQPSPAARAGLCIPCLSLIHISQALADLYNITLDELVNHHDSQGGALLTPKGKHLFGLVRVGERGQIVIPKRAREVFSISTGDQLLVLGDEEQGIAIVKADLVQSFAHELMKAAQREKAPPRSERGGEGE